MTNDALTVAAWCVESGRSWRKERAILKEATPGLRVDDAARALEHTGGRKRAAAIIAAVNKVAKSNGDLSIWLPQRIAAEHGGGQASACRTP